MADVADLEASPAQHPVVHPPLPILAVLQLAIAAADTTARRSRAIIAAMPTYAPPARHLLRARDLADARFLEPLSVSDLAAAARLSKAHFSREFKATFGISPHGYLLTRRLERAAMLLRSTDRSVADICVSVGLQSVGSFTTSFTRTYGRSPTAYRAAYPPAAAHAQVPSCVLRFYGRPEHRTFREDKPSAPA
jgi:AraC-like DNA-binding protein